MNGFKKRFSKECNYIVGSYIANRNWALDEVGQFWDSVADYDDVNEQTYSYFRRFIDGYNLCSIPDNSYVLDICARTGNGTRYFYEKGKVRKAVCADVSATFQQICTAHLKRHNIPFNTVLFDSYELPFTDAEFDGILCFETIEHVSQPLVFLKELFRILRPGGEVVLTTPNIFWEPVHSLAAILNFHHSEGPRRFLRRKILI
ncbi:MAG: methyltransferase domain-containing protein, partial [Candidatus Aenigmarchaeota archaeon]|nr:methyltransferase domain-containing protein [Candidatus Aenigmarchaeota archaeon]